MRDYEFKFYLPFKGITQPIYAIPGNHDWFSAIQAFNANFYEPEAARTANLKRLDMDLRATRSAISTVNQEIVEAARLRQEYNIHTGLQRAPFFEIHTPHFSFVSGDTGIVRDLAYYPSTQAMSGKLERKTPAWKRPVWSWIKQVRGWPAGVELLSGVFDFNQAPFFQSLMEVRVEGPLTGHALSCTESTVRCAGPICSEAGNSLGAVPTIRSSS